MNRPLASVAWINPSMTKSAISELTTRMRGRYLVVFVNERPVAGVLIDQRITNGEFLLEGDLTDDEERALVAGLNKLAGRSRDFGDTHYTP